MLLQLLCSHAANLPELADATTTLGLRSTSMYVFSSKLTVTGMGRLTMEGRIDAVRCTEISAQSCTSYRPPGHRPGCLRPRQLQHNLGSPVWQVHCTSYYEYVVHNTGYTLVRGLAAVASATRRSSSVEAP